MRTLRSHLASMLLCISVMVSAAERIHTLPTAECSCHDHHLSALCNKLSFPRNLETGLRITAPLPGWVISQDNFQIQYYVVPSRTELNVAVQGSVCETQVHLDGEALFSLEMSQANGYSASVLAVAPSGVRLCEIRHQSHGLFLFT